MSTVISILFCALRGPRGFCALRLFERVLRADLRDPPTEPIALRYALTCSVASIGGSSAKRL